MRRIRDAAAIYTRRRSELTRPRRERCRHTRRARAGERQPSLTTRLALARAGERQPSQTTRLAPRPWGRALGPDPPPPPKPACFEEDCRASPFIMHAGRTANGSAPGSTLACFAFVAIGCYAAPKGCCPMVARRFSGIEFDVSE